MSSIVLATQMQRQDCSGVATSVASSCSNVQPDDNGCEADGAFMTSCIFCSIKLWMLNVSYFQSVLTAASVGVLEIVAATAL